MNNETPKTDGDEMYTLLRDEKIDEFNAKRAGGQGCSLKGMHLRNLDLRDMDVEGIDFSDSYLRGADLRGLNMSSCRMEGASIRNAKISGTLFPKELSTDEIRLSLDQGTRMRTDR
jgi:uncharacterized protein YjbI with pentapeptide repeats